MVCYPAGDEKGYAAVGGDPVLFIGREDIRMLLPMSRCIPLMERAMRETSAGRVVQPPRLTMRLQNSINLFGAMIGHAYAAPVLGAKVMTVFPSNHGTELPSHQGLVLLFDPETGSPAAILDGFEITAQRTAAVSAVATKALSTDAPSRLAILGTGEQALRHLAAIRLVRDLLEVRIWGRSPNKSQAFAERASATHVIPVRAVNTVAEAVAGASIVCCVTASRDPILRESMLELGMHINAVGASTAAAAEVDAAVVPRVRFYVDQRDMAQLNAAEYRRALSEGLVAEGHIAGELGEVLLGSRPGRRAADEITLYKSLGIPAQDLFAAGDVLEQARRQGRGTPVAF